ncbi:DUF485 domain-containing protein [Actinoplanes sp. NPDC023714]|uniref:DUF485 domain-containing protein n=1 Tax=Actinoplanes sp. NPDC023714 TaxID=3154322 RepID=UPI0033D1E7CA
MPASAERYLEVQRSEEFAQLRHRLRRFIFPTTIAFIVWYALYVLLSAYARDFMSIKVIGNINVALIFGVLQFISTFAIAWVYARYAAKELDPRADAIYQELESTPSATSSASSADGGAN